MCKINMCMIVYVCKCVSLCIYIYIYIYIKVRDFMDTNEKGSACSTFQNVY